MDKTAKTHPDYPLEVWEKLELVVEENGDAGVYASRVEDFTDAGIIISQPEWIKGSKHFLANARVFVQFMKSDAMYRFPARTRPIRGKYSERLLLSDIGSMKRMQRREFVRISFTTRLKYSLINDLRDSNQEFVWFSSISSNISAGGLLMRVDDKVKKDDLLLLKFEDYLTFRVPRFITAVCRRTTVQNEVTFAGVEFITEEKIKDYFSAEEINKLPSQVAMFNANVQNRLVRFVFEEQVRERNKGLI